MKKGLAIKPEEAPDAGPPPPLYEGEIQKKMEQLANAFAGSFEEDGMQAMLRVRQFARYAGINLANSVASIEALEFIKAVPHGRYYIMWMDLSVMRSHTQAQRAINAYVQAMRTAIGRVRKNVKRTGSNRQLRKFGVTVREMLELPECPCLWRVVLDNRHNATQDRFAALVNTATFEAMTVSQTANPHGGSEIEQIAELKKRGIEGYE